MLITEIVEPFAGRLLDPARGSGGMYVQSARFVKAHRGNLAGDLVIDPAVEWAMPATSSGWLRATTRPAPTRSGHRWRYPILAVARTKAVHFPLHRPLSL